MADARANSIVWDAPGDDAAVIPSEARSCHPERSAELSSRAERGVVIPSGARSAKSRDPYLPSQPSCAPRPDLGGRELLGRGADPSTALGMTAGADPSTALGMTAACRSLTSRWRAPLGMTVARDPPDPRHPLGPCVLDASPRVTQEPQLPSPFRGSGRFRPRSVRAVPDAPFPRAISIRTRSAPPAPPRDSTATRSSAPPTARCGT